MTADLREAFHIAAVELLGWRRVNEQQRWIGWRNIATNQRQYLPEPTVEFFGRVLKISEICKHAASMSGPLPAHICALFRVIDDGLGEDLPTTYFEAVEALDGAIWCEHELQDDHPLTKPSILDEERGKSFVAGVNSVRPQSGQ